MAATSSGEKTVFVFGAGASVSLGPPMVSHVLDYALGKQPLFRTDGDSGYLSENDRKILQGFLESSFPNSSPNIEELLSIVDLAISARTTFGIYNLEALYKILNILQRAVSSTISESLRYEDGTFFDENLRAIDNPYEVLIGRLKTDDTIVTFNYDGIIEFTLEEMNLLRRIDFCAEFQRIWIDSELKQKIDILGQQIEEPRIHVLKLHGSVNWHRCLGCGNYTWYPSTRGFDPPDPSDTRDPDWLYACCPGTPWEIAIVPPTFLKTHHDRVLEQIWARAFKELRVASEIVFIGYSLPESDLDARLLFVRALAARTPRPKITVVNPDRAVQGKYERLLGPVTFLPITFEAYMA
jgi:SIR2-like domain